MPIETRPESEAWRSAGGETPLHLSHSNSPIRTIELDLDSLGNAEFEDVSFVEYLLAEFAVRHHETVAPIYAHDTPSTNFGDFNNAVFLGVVGSNDVKILKILKSDLQYRRGIPDAVIREQYDRRLRGWNRRPERNDEFEMQETIPCSTNSSRRVP